MSDPTVARIRGPRGLPEAIQGPTLGESLRRAASYLANTAQGLPAIWSDSLAHRLRPVEDLLRAAATELTVAEDQLQDATDKRWAEMEKEDELADALEAALEWAEVQTGNAGAGAERFFAAAARAALRKAGRRL